MSRFIQEIRTGSNHGPIASFVSRGNLTVLNPFVLWDHFAISCADNTAGFDFHGHSGVATISYPLISSIKHEDTGGHTGHLLSGGIQVMSAGEMGIFNASDDEIQVSTTNNAAEFLLVAGKPLAQPIISTGPSVHSSRHNAILGSRQINKLQMQLTH